MINVLFVLKPNLSVSKYQKILKNSAFFKKDVKYSFSFANNISFDIEPNLIVTIGGDGTFLSAARFTVSHGNNAPILGVNTGSLGFLTLFDLDNFIESIEAFFKQKLFIEKRGILSFSSKDGDLIALNDIVVNRSGVARILDYDIFVDDEFLSNVKADGLIISTPTGSTAYSLASGGPVVESSLNVIILTPISPHTLANRPIVIDDKKNIKVLVKNMEKDVIISADGQEFLSINADTDILIKTYKERVSIVKPKKNGYFATLRQKLHLGVRG